MTPPDRSADVRTWLAQHKNLFVSRPDGDADAVRRAALDPLCRYLNKIEGIAKWGKLIKTNQGNHIPHDIIVWKDTKEHFDVFTGAEKVEDTKPTWGYNPPAPDGWNWLAVEDGDDDDDDDHNEPDDSDLAAKVATLQAQMLEAGFRDNRQVERLGLLEQELEAARDRIQVLEDKPNPGTFDVDALVADLIVEGNTKSSFGHVHGLGLGLKRRSRMDQGAAVRRTFTALVLVGLFAGSASAQALKMDRALKAWAPQHQPTAELLSNLTLTAAIVGDTWVSIHDERPWRALGLQGVRYVALQGGLYGLKRLVHRERPCAPACGVEDASHSFPSGHAASAALSLGGPRWQIVVPMTVGTGYFRVAANKHFWTDVAMGGALGWAVSRIR